MIWVIFAICDGAFFRQRRRIFPATPRNFFG
jgi:hypothetical protein